MSFELIDALYRSRLTVLSLLKSRGYNTAPYERFSVREIELMFSNDGSLDFRAEKIDPDDKTVCHVLYYKPRFKKLNEFVDELNLSEEEAARSEFLVMLQDEIGPSHSAAANRHWLLHKRKVHFFYLYRLVNNPLEHVLQPKFEIIPEDKHDALLKALNCTSSAQLPIMCFHGDVVTRCLGLVPGDIVKIIRPSESAGEAVVYSVCKYVAEKKSL